jgi:hypothetical protein
MGNYVICKDKGKLKLGCYVYSHSSNRFSVVFGTTDKTHYFADELPFEIIADLMFDEKRELWTVSYPKNNTLKIYMKVVDESITEEVIKKLKGFKKFFGHMNIKNIEFMKYAG